ncbi:MAG: DCC1-like thiol-disulfide oxidoreductase family protein [Candidatus Methylacidiphilales bacterium]|nr:DCC1-like thiol-disulfide oxidoreductase family protein [Candidatus Methylacidiphilales bacterium]
MKRLTVLYDGSCGFCCRCRDWLEAQDQIIPLEFLPLQSEEVARRFGDLRQMRPEEQMLAIADNGDLWMGDAAWVMCLYTLRDYRDLADKFAHSSFRPLIRNLYRLISSNRHRVSNLLGLQPDGLKDAAMGVLCHTGGCSR